VESSNPQHGHRVSEKWVERQSDSPFAADKAVLEKIAVGRKVSAASVIPDEIEKCL
jgi:hypothetical protein